MLRHIVMIKLKDDVDKPLVSREIMNILYDLEYSVDSLIKMEVGINISTKESAYDVVLTADFDDIQGLDRYRVHPEHVKVLEYLNNVMEKAAVVDYTS